MTCHWTGLVFVCLTLLSAASALASGPVPHPMRCRVGSSYPRGAPLATACGYVAQVPHRGRKAAA